MQIKVRIFRGLFRFDALMLPWVKVIYAFYDELFRIEFFVRFSVS